MKVSIIITSYNEKEYLIQAIESCLSQDYKGDYEIIISDDGSTDGSVEILKEYIDSYPGKIKGVFDKRDDGVEFLEYRESNCRERGINISSGDYLMILDGDDLVAPNKLSVQAEFLDNNPKYVACYTDFEWFWDDGRRLLTKFNYSEINSVLLWSKIYIHLSSFLFRRSVISNFIPRFINDNMAVRSILKTGRVYHIPGVTFKYRQRNESLWHTYDELEKDITTVVALQAAIDSNWFYCSSLSKYRNSLNYVFDKRIELDNEKYQRYFYYLSDYEGHLLSTIRNYSELRVLKKYKFNIVKIQSILCGFFFAAAKRFFEIFNRKSISITENIGI